MAKSIGSKLWTATLGKLNALVDKAYDTPESFAQCIRDLEKALAELRAAHDEAVGTKNGILVEIRTLETKIAKHNANIDLLLGDDDDTNDDAAITLQIQVDKLTEDLEDTQSNLTEAEVAVSQLALAISKGEEKRNEMARNLKRLQMTSKTTESKNKASAAIEDALEAFSDSGSIDSISGKIDAKSRTADAKFNRVVGQLDTKSPEQLAAEAKAKSAIAARKAALQKNE